MNPPNEFYVTQKDLASKGKRFGNFIIDYIIQMVLGAGVGVLIAITAELTGNYGLYDIVVESDSRFIDYVFGFIILIIYYTTIETLTGRSIGKYITKTKVVLKDGSKPTINEILIRSLCRIIPFEQFSFLGDLGKGWHDTLSKTFVVDIEKFEANRDASSGIEQIGKAIED